MLSLFPSITDPRTQSIATVLGFAAASITTFGKYVEKIGYVSDTALALGCQSDGTINRRDVR